MAKNTADFVREIGELHRGNFHRCAPASLDKFTGSELGRPKVARRVRADTLQQMGFQKVYLLVDGAVGKQKVWRWPGIEAGRAFCQLLDLRPLQQFWPLAGARGMEYAEFPYK